MQPIGPLMHEHRRIERLVALVNNEMENIRQGEEPDVEFLRDAANFFSLYADRCHHGKEEDILFRALAEKDLPDDLGSICEQLIEEHIQARKLVSALRQALSVHQTGLETGPIADILQELTSLYPRHILTEDKDFFHQCMKLFSREEMDSMLAQFEAFDRNLVHEQFESLVKKYESGRNP